MKKKMFFSILFLMLMILPFLNVNAESRKVTDQETLKSALADSDVSEIILGNDIETTEKINITRAITIDGGGHTIKYVGGFGDNNDYTTWKGIYVLQVYKTSATIKNIKLTGGNAALLVNGSRVHLVGNIDVSGNGFGGIELGQGSGVEDTVRLELDTTTKIINTTENENAPTLWVPSDSDPAILEMDGKEITINTGAELSLPQIENYFAEPINPETSDKLVIYLTLIGLGLTIFHFGTKKYLQV